MTEITSSYRLNLDEKIKIETTLEKGIDVEADRVRIGQVIRNLVNNALSSQKKETSKLQCRIIYRKTLSKSP